MAVDEPGTTQVTGTITQAVPLRLVVDGATVDCPASSLDTSVYQAGNRVTVTIRNPRRPLVQGREASGDPSELP